MSEIDEKAFAEAIETHYPKWGGNEIYHYRNVVEAYETAKAPRTISRDEYENYKFVTKHSGYHSGLATLGITVREK
jgi:hypothetical protein